jgi:hypothetical protein
MIANFSDVPGPGSLQVGLEQALAPGYGVGTFTEGAWDKLMKTKGM